MRPPQVDLRLLRQVAVVRGLVDSGLRRRVWPLLLGLPLGALPRPEYAAEARGEHGDVQTIRNDVARSLHGLTEGGLHLAWSLGLLKNQYSVTV